MKIIRLVSVLSAAAFLLSGCGSTSTAGNDNYDNQSPSAVSGTNSASENSSENIDIDMTQMNSNMVYAQVYDMINYGDNYLGKKVKVKGAFSYFKENDGREFFAVLISDASACCSQGIEFVLTGEHKYPDDYPALNTEITVTGEFNSYVENGITYCQLLNAEMQVDQGL
ncbi:MAG: hypothetical protein IKW96_09490 [Ruminococcus sp.]|uniref:hypothetical protein n=1 Tax=Ruminococcus sp. TaxID=41978 RepID=UPI0025CCE555|nr:hypothetical protein [Ruminococcus sp.]MBR5683484.1 hypothetical protein [Ruminococcus sp.]